MYMKTYTIRERVNECWESCRSKIRVLGMERVLVVVWGTDGEESKFVRNAGSKNGTACYS